MFQRNREASGQHGVESPSKDMTEEFLGPRPRRAVLCKPWGPRGGEKCVSNGRWGVGAAAACVTGDPDKVRGLCL